MESTFYSLWKLSTSNGIFKKYGLKYNKTQLGELNKLMGLRLKMHRLRLTNEFLASCIVNKILPNFLVFRLQRSKVKHSPTMERAFLNDEIGKNLSRSKSLLCFTRSKETLLHSGLLILTISDF